MLSNDAHIKCVYIYLLRTLFTCTVHRTTMWLRPKHYIYTFLNLIKTTEHINPELTWQNPKENQTGEPHAPTFGESQLQRGQKLRFWMKP
jgi:hypothetical protein